MEPKFINEYCVTFDLYKEWANSPLEKREIQKRKKGIRLRIAGCIMGVSIIILGALISEFFTVFIGAAFFVYFILRLFYIPNKLLKKEYDYFLKINNGDHFRSTITFSDNVTYEDNKNTAHYEFVYFEYSEISKISEDEKCFFLFLDADIVLRILKNSFTLGAPDEFREFINNAVADKAKLIETEESGLGLKGRSHL